MLLSESQMPSELAPREREADRTKRGLARALPAVGMAVLAVRGALSRRLVWSLKIWARVIARLRPTFVEPRFGGSRLKRRSFAFSDADAGLQQR